MERIATSELPQDDALFRQAIEACLRARNYAHREDGLGLAMAVALLRCDLAERGGMALPLNG
jgi:hypothetical protein